MKRVKALALSATLAAVAFTSCSKNGSFEPAASDNEKETSVLASRTTAITAPTSDRIDAIMKDLSSNSYSLSFDKAMPDYGITRTAYGADNYLVYADPQTLRCPDPILYRYKKIPIWRRPNFVQPTCPDMSPDIYKLRQIRELLAKADYTKYGALKEVSLLSGGGFLADERFLSQFQNTKLDRIDEITKDLRPDSYLLLNDPNSYTDGFTRSAYGYADLNSLVFRRYGYDLKKIFRPTLKGCFDPKVLDLIRQRLQSINPVTYKSLTVSPLAENKAIATLANQY